MPDTGSGTDKRGRIPIRPELGKAQALRLIGAHSTLNRNRKEVECQRGQKFLETPKRCLRHRAGGRNSRATFCMRNDPEVRYEPPAASVRVTLEPNCLTIEVSYRAPETP